LDTEITDKLCVLALSSAKLQVLAEKFFRFVTHTPTVTVYYNVKESETLLRCFSEN